jgi:hypothetical protein
MDTPSDPLQQLTKDGLASLHACPEVSHELLMEAEDELDGLRFNPAPGWLGSFGLLCFGQGYGRGRQLPTACRKTAILLRDQIWGLYGCDEAPPPNAAFLQRYTPGFTVRRHVDPKSNLGITAILSLGDFHPLPTVRVWTPSSSSPKELNPGRGDVVVLPCHTSHGPGPAHSVEGHFLQQGTRYAIILNHVQL